MKLVFGLELDDLVLPRHNKAQGGMWYCGRKNLLQLLESHLGLAGLPDDIEYLRIEQYRQALLHLVDKQTAEHSTDNPFFFFHAFKADQFATATELLSRRDELLLAGWNFKTDTRTPPRLRTLAQIEEVFEKNSSGKAATPVLTPGFADRFATVLEKLDTSIHPFAEIWLNEPLELMPVHFRRLFQKMAATGNKPTLRQLPQPKTIDPHAPLSDLQKLQLRLHQTEPTPKVELANDGTLLLLHARRSGEAAAFLAGLLRLNPSFRPACLIPEKNRTLDMALIQEGLPSLGILSESLARPTLQILKLAPTFLWEPVDPFKILEFVSLAVKPLADDLATLIANQIARAPGLQSEGWYAMISRYFEELAESDNEKAVAEQRSQYNFWFERERYPMDKTVPKSDVVQIFAYLRDWSIRAFDDNGSKNNSLLVLSEQSKRIVELLQALPENELTYLELERIVRTIYEPAPVVFQENEAGHYPYTMHPSAFTDEVNEVLWCNFIQNDPPHFFSRWYHAERQYLQSSGIHLETPESENTRLLWQRLRPMLLARKRLMLVMPETVNGKEVHPHPLFGDLEAAFSNLQDITFKLDTGAGKENLQKHFNLPRKIRINPRQLGKPKPFLHIRNLDQLNREQETLTSLETLFYYPYQWFFKYKIRLNKSSILSVVKDNTLMGNLSHRVFEKLLKQGIHRMSKSDVEKWVDTETRKLLSKEGAVLLMYGREPERVAFVNKLKYAAWSLISHIRENGWTVKETEMTLEGNFPIGSHGQSQAGSPVKGIADLVLQRGDELAVLDLKWRGATHRENVIRNGEDLQLVLYSRLLSPSDSWAHTGYFIIENGKLIARNNHAFKGINAVAPQDDHQLVNRQILSRMETTWQWRMNQLAKGQIEIRCRQTIRDIELAYSTEEQGSSMMDLLEMKGEDARYDDFITLINLVE
jgi:hypothetical protein